MLSYLMIRCISLLEWLDIRRAAPAVHDNRKSRRRDASVRRSGFAPRTRSGGEWIDWIFNNRAEFRILKVPCLVRVLGVFALAH